METLQSINRETDEKQQLSIPRKELNLKICENRNAKSYFKKPLSREGKLFMSGKLIV